MRSKSTNKDKMISLRLTPHQDFMLSQIVEQLNANGDEKKIDKSKLLRFVIDKFLQEYE